MAFNTHKLILASTSKARVALLREAGICFEALSPAIDETVLQHTYASLPPSQLALQLARAKARSVTSEAHYVIGADQTLELDGRVMHKAKSLADARANLIAMRGKSHHLHSAVSVIYKGAEVYSNLASATLQMRLLSDAEISAYMTTEKEALLSSVGGYHIEGAGRELFDKITGEIDTIQGLPLQPLLAFLKQQAIIAR